MNEHRNCPRCGEPFNGGFMMSIFEPVDICMICIEEEKMHPEYTRAKEAEAATVKRGEMNFPGIGYTPPPEPETQTFLEFSIDTSGPDGNAFAIIGTIKRILERADRRDLVPGFLEAAKSGNYFHLKAVARQYVKVKFI